MKIGPNFEDKNRIREWAEQGLDADEISKKVLVKPEAVQVFLDSLEPAEEELSPQQRGAITRAKNKAAAEAAEEEEDGEADG